MSGGSVWRRRAVGRRPAATPAAVRVTPRRDAEQKPDTRVPTRDSQRTDVAMGRSQVAAGSAEAGVGESFWGAGTIPFLDRGGGATVYVFVVRFCLVEVKGWGEGDFEGRSVAWARGGIWGGRRAGADGHAAWGPPFPSAQRRRPEEASRWLGVRPVTRTRAGACWAGAPTSIALPAFAAGSKFSLTKSWGWREYGRRVKPGGGGRVLLPRSSTVSVSGGGGVLPALSRPGSRAELCLPKLAREGPASWHRECDCT